MYATAGNCATRSGVMKIPLITIVHLLAARAGSRPGKAVSTNFDFTFQFFAIAFARSMSNPTALPAAALYSIGGKVGLLQNLREPLIGAAVASVPNTARAASKGSRR